MKKYVGLKLIEAEPKDYPEGELEGYKVKYEDGYTSWSPKDVFEKSYKSTEDGMDFGMAIFMLKRGHKVARKGWNGKGMFLYYVPPGSYPARTDIAKSIGDYVDYGAYIAMKTAQGNVVPWLASQTDMLGEDWVVLP